MPSTGQTLCVDPCQPVQQKLTGIKGDDLMNATVADGSSLIPDQYRTPGNTSSLADSIKRCTDLAARVPVPECQVQRAGLAARGSLGAPHASLTGLRRLAPALDYTPWRLSFAGTDITFEDLGPAHADRLMRQVIRKYPAAPKHRTWTDDLGDFLAGVRDGFIAVAEVVMKPVQNGAKALVTCVIDGAAYVFRAALRTLGAVLDMIETIFAKVQVLFAKLFEWIGFLFNWGDIIRTHKAITYIADQFLTFLGDAADGLKNLADTTINDMKSQLGDAFQKARNQFGTSTSVGSYLTSGSSVAPVSSDLQAARSNTVVINALTENADRATIAQPPTQSQLSGMGKQTRGLAKLVQGNENFAGIKDWFTQLGASTDNMFTSVLDELLQLVEKLVEAILDGVKEAVDALLGQVKTLVADLRQTLDAAWNIPLLSPLYEKISGGAELTTLDLIALVAAVPVTISYKVMEGRAPFPDDASLAAFTESFTASSMLQASGLAPVTTSVLSDLSIKQSAENQKFLLDTSGTLLFINGVVCAFGDSGLDGGGVKIVLSIVADALQLGALGTSLPWFFSDRPATWVIAHWGWTFVAVGFDCVMTVIGGVRPEWQGTVLILIAASLGCLLLFTGIMASTEPAEYFGNLGWVIPEICKFLRIKPIAKEYGGVALKVLAVIDVVGGAFTFGGCLYQTKAITD